jgi:hypothetical protein
MNSLIQKFRKKIPSLDRTCYKRVLISMLASLSLETSLWANLPPLEIVNNSRHTIFFKQVTEQLSKNNWRIQKFKNYATFIPDKNAYINIDKWFYFDDKILNSIFFEKISNLENLQFYFWEEIKKQLPKHEKNKIIRKYWNINVIFSPTINNHIIFVSRFKEMNNKFILLYYENGNLKQATFVSPGSYKRKTSKFIVNTWYMVKNKLSQKYKLAPMPFSIHLKWWYFLHWGSKVTWDWLSHGCIRIWWGPASILYKNIKNIKETWYNATVIFTWYTPLNSNVNKYTDNDLF